MVAMTLPWMAAKILLRPVAELRPHAGNARVHSAAQLEQIKSSMLALPSLTAGSTTNIDVTVPGARRGDFADASLDTSSIAFVLDCHVWSNNSVRVTARNVSASTVDLAAAALSVQIVKRRVA
jgi:hypothetical protein